MLAATALGWFSAPAGAASPDIVISQVYGGRGNTGAVYTADFVELFNRGNLAVDLSGWSLQYGSATGLIGTASSDSRASLTGTIPSGGYYLVGLGSGGGNGVPLPT